MLTPMLAPMLKGPLIGIAMMLAAQVLMPINDTLAKYLVASLPALQVSWARFFFNALLILPMVFWRRGPGALRASEPGLQIARGATIVTANVLFIIGVHYVPLADALATVFIAPLAVTALSARFLGETIRPAQWGAVALGFAGAMVIVRPGFSELHIASLLPLCSGLLFAVYLTLTRHLARSSPPDVTLAITVLIGGLSLSVAVPFVWVPPTPGQLALMAITGLISGVGHMLITTAHVHAAASTLAPLTYLALVTAAVLGFLVFGDVPDLPTVLGAAIVIGSGLFVWWAGRAMVPSGGKDA